MTKLLITGAHSTGKTTTINAAGEKLAGLSVKGQILPDCARACPYPIGRQQSTSTSLWLMLTQMRNEIEAHISAQSFVLCDRGIPDILAHWKEVEMNIGGVDSTRESMEPLIAAWMKTYDYVLLSTISPHLDVENDGLREADVGYREGINAAIRLVLNEYEVPYYVLPLDLEERTELILKCALPSDRIGDQAVPKGKAV